MRSRQQLVWAANGVDNRTSTTSKEGIAIMQLIPSTRADSDALSRLFTIDAQAELIASDAFRSHREQELVLNPAARGSKCSV